MAAADLLVGAAARAPARRLGRRQHKHRPWGGGGRDYFSRACVRSKGVGGKVEALTVFSSRACVLKAEGTVPQKKRLKGTTVFSRGREYEI